LAPYARGKTLQDLDTIEKPLGKIVSTKNHIGKQKPMPFITVLVKCYIVKGVVIVD